MRNFLKIIVGLFLFSVFTITSFAMDSKNFNTLTDAEKFVIEKKGTERPFTGKYDKFFDKGLYVCKRCSSALYLSQDKFDAGCGWPAFDEELKGAVKRVQDADGKRMEILCARCNAHLGHVFEGEKLTKKNVRHCVNSVSMNFVPAENIDKALVAGGCFWGVEALMRSINGVYYAASGYTGGKTKNPSYEDVCKGDTGHFEAVEILFDKTKTSYKEILKAFFEIHDFTQVDGQGPDKGPQYFSAIFVENAEQRKIAEELIAALSQKGFKVATQVLDAKEFYPAEDYHLRYYEKSGKKPYCHFRRKIF